MHCRRNVCTLFITVLHCLPQLPALFILRHWFPISFYEVVCGFSWLVPNCWEGTIFGDRRSFVRNLKQKKAPVVIGAAKRGSRLGR
jgi:hypothetical protein